jgi:hypothetical protein
VTESVVTLSNVSAVGGAEHPRASARARVKPSVTRRDRVKRLGAARPLVAARRVGRVMYLDAADSWIVRESTPSIRQVWATDYSATVPGDFVPFARWCRAYRYPAVGAAAVLDSVKWMLIHPVRGPLFIATSVGVAAAIR